VVYEKQLRKVAESTRKIRKNEKKRETNAEKALEKENMRVPLWF
jgi:hypothetical protein